MMFCKTSYVSGMNKTLNDFPQQLFYFFIICIQVLCFGYISILTHYKNPKNKLNNIHIILQDSLMINIYLGNFTVK